jgi:hypothetical protein
MSPCIKCGHDANAVVIAEWTMTIPRALPSLNERIHNGAKGWRYRRTRDAWASDLRAMRLVARHKPTNLANLRRVTLTRLYTGRMREMDLANIDTKACVDAMKLAGLIFDDAPRYYEGHVMQERCGERGTRITIEELT